MSTAEGIKKLLLEGDVGPRPGGFGGPLTEPVLVFRGEHARGFTLFNQSGQRVGSAVAVDATSPARRSTHVELRDLGAHRALGARSVLTVHDTGSRFSRLLRGREYEIVQPDAARDLIVPQARPARRGSVDLAG